MDKKSILIVAPHTSNWDVIVGVLVKWAYEINNIKAPGKHTLFNVPLLNIFLKKIGIIPVDRSIKNHLVDSLSKHLLNNEHAIVSITPEGTRSWAPRWHLGFYRIAQNTNIDITCVSFDYSRRIVEFSQKITPSGDIANDMQIIAEYYKDKKGKNPDQQGPIIY